MKKLNFNLVTNFIITLTALSILIYLSLVYISTHGLGMIYNSDIISIPYLYKDLFYHGDSLSQWLFPTTMEFFPDVIVYFLLVTIVGNLKVAIALFAVYQFLLYYILIVAIGKKVIKDHAAHCLFQLSVFVTFFLYSAGYLQQNIFYAPIFSGHFGTALMFLVGLWLILNSFSTKKTKLNYALLSILCLATVYSDLLYITQFVITALISLYILMFIVDKEKGYICRINMWVIAISSFVSYILYHNSKFFFHLYITHDHPLRRHHLHDLVLATKQVITDLSLFYQNNAIIILLLFTFFMVSCVYLIRVYQRYKHYNISDKDIPFIFTILMLFISIIIGYLSLIFLDNNLMSGDPSLRHFQPFILFPVFLGLPLYLAYYTNLAEVMQKYYKTIVAAIVLCAVIFTPAWSIATLITYYPAPVACIDQYAQQYQLKNGVGQYWYAKLFTFLSKENVNIVAITLQKQNVIPYITYNSVHDYLNKDFNFAIVGNGPNDSIDAKDIIRAYGPPSEILQCANTQSDPLSIYIYKNGIINSTWTKKELTV